MQHNLKTATERVRDSLLTGCEDDYSAACRALWRTYRGPQKPVSLPGVRHV